MVAGAIRIDRENGADLHTFLAVRAKGQVNFHAKGVEVPDESLPSPERAKKSAKCSFFDK